MRLTLLSLMIYLTCIYCVGQEVHSDKDSLSQLKETFRITQESRNWTTYLKTTISIAEAYSDEDLLDSSIWYLEKALDQDYNNKGLDSLWALCYHTLGIQYYWITDDLSAIENWSKALELRKQFLPSNHIDIIKGYRNIGNSHYELENTEEAIENFNQAYDLNSSRDVPDLVKEAQLALDLSTAYMKSEDLDKAFRFLTLAEESTFKTYDDNHWELELIYYQWWSYYNLKGDANLMKSYANKSIELLQSVENKSIEDEISIARALINLGLAYKMERNFLEGIDPFLNAIKICQDYDDNEGVDKFLSISYSNLSLMYSHLKDYSNALLYIDNALNIDTKLSDQKSIIKDLENKSDILKRKGDLAQALTIINQANALVRPTGDETTYLVSRPLRVLLNRSKCEILSNLCDQNRDKKYLEEAILLLENNISIIDEIRNSYQSEESKAFLAIESKEILEEGIGYYISLFKYTKDQSHVLNAWELSEKAKSIILLESLRASQAKIQTGVEDELLIKEDSLKKELAFIENEIYNQPEDVASLNKAYLESSKELEIIIQKISVENPTYSRATEAISKLSLEEYIDHSDSDIVEYFIGNENAYIFVKTSEGINCYTIDAPSEINVLVDQVRKSTIEIFKTNLDKKNKYNEAIELYNRSAYSLYDKLFGQVVTELVLQENLLVIPDGVLGYLPFDLLLTDRIESEDFSTKPYMILDHNISYTYSLALLEEMRASDSHSNNNMLAMAPSFATNDEVYIYNDRKVKKEKQPELYFNVDEIESIQTIMDCNNVVGSDATEAYFINNAKDYNIIHLSTHGKANDEKGNFSYLAFTEIVDSTENEFVYNYDLYNLKLNADMVVLSACETGIGELKEGEGIVSLARGFSYAGAKSIVSTLWTINDYRTKEIMESFYTHISEGKSKDWSLRQSKLSFIQNNPKEALPFYWAAFIPVGDMSPISYDEMNFLPSLLTGLLFIIVVFFLYKYWGRNS